MAMLQLKDTTSKLRVSNYIKARKVSRLPGTPTCTDNNRLKIKG